MIAFARQQKPAPRRGYKRRFLQLLPRIRNHARFAFRALKGAEREEATSEVIASAYCAFHRLLKLGKADVVYATPLAHYAVGQHWAGRRVAAAMNSGDVLSPIAAHRKRVCVCSLHPKDAESDWAETLVDNSRSPVPDQVAFRIDFPQWLKRLKHRDRRLAKFLLIGNSTSETARQFGLSWGRVSQLRESLRKNWQAFHGEVEHDAVETSSGPKQTSCVNDGYHSFNSGCRVRDRLVVPAASKTSTRRS